MNGIEYDDRLKSEYPHVEDCLWAVYLRSIEENKENPREEAYLSDEQRGPWLFGKLTGLRDASRLSVGGGEILGGPNFDVVRPFSSSSLRSGSIEYKIYQMYEGSRIEVSVFVTENPGASRTSHLCKFRNLYYREVMPKGRTLEDQSLKEECLGAFRELKTLAIQELGRQLRVSALLKLAREMVNEYGYAYLEQAAEADLCGSLQEIDNKGIDEYFSWIDQFLAAQQVVFSSFVGSMDNHFFEGLMD